MNVLIIGGGASGMLAALTAAENPENRVVLAERQARVGKKLSATGNGRCNLTNTKLSPANYHGKAPEFALPALKAFTAAETLKYFESLGLLWTEEPSGRVYPFSDQAGSVVDVLRLAVDAAGVELVTGCEITGLRAENGGFTADYEGGSLHADRVIVACGGCAGGKLGGTDLGYRLMKQTGHSATELKPSLVQLCTDRTLLRGLKGIRTVCRVSVFTGGGTAAESFGEVQFTDYGVSGPAVFEISRAAAFCRKRTEIVLDLLPQEPEEETVKRLSAHRARYPQRALEDLLTGTLQNRLGRSVLLSCGFGLGQSAGSLSDRDLSLLAEKLHRFALKLEGTTGFDQAQVTAGGVRTSQFDPDTLESRICPGLYACGEVLDIDGDCGGCNLQWAWSSGRLAGRLLHKGETA